MTPKKTQRWPISWGQKLHPSVTEDTQVQPRRGRTSHPLGTAPRTQRQPRVPAETWETGTRTLCCRGRHSTAVGGTARHPKLHTQPHEPASSNMPERRGNVGYKQSRTRQSRTRPHAHQELRGGHRRPPTCWAPGGLEHAKPREGCRMRPAVRPTCGGRPRQQVHGVSGSGLPGPGGRGCPWGWHLSGVTKGCGLRRRRWPFTFVNKLTAAEPHAQKGEFCGVSRTPQ